MKMNYLCHQKLLRDNYIFKLLQYKSFLEFLLFLQ